MTSGKAGACGRGDGGSGNVEQGIGIGPQVKPRVLQLPAVVFEIDRLLAGEQLHDHAEAVFQQAAGLGLRQADHGGIGRQGAGAGAEHDPAAGQVVEQHDPLRHP